MVGSRRLGSGANAKIKKAWQGQAKKIGSDEVGTPRDRAAVIFRKGRRDHEKLVHRSSLS